MTTIIAVSGDDPGRRGDVESLLRGLRVLEALAESRDGASPQELVELTGLDRSTVQRIVRTLVGAGYLERMSRGRYGVAPAALSLAVRLLDAPHLRRLAYPPMASLQAKLGEIMNIAVLSGSDVVYIARIAPRNVMSINLAVGSRLPAYCTSLGRAILAWLPDEQARAIVDNAPKTAYTPNTLTQTQAIMKELARARSAGYAVVDQELDLALRAIAVPLRAANGAAVASIDISVSAVRMTIDKMETELAPDLVALGQQISRLLGFLGES